MRINAAVNHLLEVMVDSDIDDEPETEAERRAVAASREWLKNNPGIPFEQVAADLGFSTDQIRRNRTRREADRLLRTGQS